MADPVNASIVEHFQTLEDPRIERTKKHLLLDILVIAVCTLLTGGEGFQDMELFGKSKRAWLQTFLALPHGIPSHDTFGRVFARLNPQRFHPTLTAPDTSERKGEEDLWGISRSYWFLLSIHPLKCLDTWKSEIALTYRV
jgi:DDE_Tnp_1-associated